jgi:hypothetical protein
MNLALAVAVVGSLMLIAAAFRTSAGWGLATLLIPGAFVLFLFAHWREARSGFFTLLVAAALIVGAGVAGGLPALPASEAAAAPVAEPAEAPADTHDAAPAPPPASPQSSAQPSPGVRWVGQARDAAGAQQQRDGAAGLP